MPGVGRLALLKRHLSSSRNGQQLLQPVVVASAAAAEKSAAAEAAAGERGWDMSDEELYMFDTMGFLRVRNMLDKATVSHALDSAMRIADGDPYKLLRNDKPSNGGSFYDNAFLHDKLLERISRLPRMLDYVCHVTNNQPRLSEQILMVQNSEHAFNNFHLRKDNDSQIMEDAPRFHTDYVNRRIYMDHASFFVYLTDVNEGDGGLCVVPGGHRTSFKYPQGMFYPPGAQPRDSTERQKLGFVQVTAKAGDCIIMPLRLNHVSLSVLASHRLAP